MLSVEIDEANDIAILEPDGPLSKDDFVHAARIIDPYIEDNAQLKGLVIHTESFPGWESFAALCSHLKFVKEHHEKISRVALSTNSALGNFAESIASHFVNAEVKLYSYQELNAAKDWVAGDAANKVT